MPGSGRGDPDIGVNAAGQPGAHNSGTNYSPGMGQLPMHASLLFAGHLAGFGLTTGTVTRVATRSGQGR